MNPKNEIIKELVAEYTTRLSKIKKAASKIDHWNAEKAWKESAATQTKRFITDLRKLDRQLKIHVEQSEALLSCTVDLPSDKDL